MSGAGPGGAAIYADVIGDAAEVANVQPQTVPGSPDYTVSNLTELNAALASASAGETILVQDGTYGAWTPTKTNAGAAIRVVAENWWATEGTYATFSSITLDGVSGVSFENLYVTGNFTDRPDQGNDGGSNYSVLSCWLGYIYIRATGGITLQYNVVDKDYAGQCMNCAALTGLLTVRNNIFARGGNANGGVGSDNIQIQGHDELIFEYNAIWGNSVLDDSDPHPDLLQINGLVVGTGKVTIRRNMLYGGLVEGGGYKGAQGLFLSDGTWPNSENDISENLICDTGLTRALSVNGLAGVIEENTVLGRIMLEDKGGTGDNSGLTIQNNYSESITAEGSSGSPAVNTGNTTYSPGSYADDLDATTSTKGASWREYLPSSGEAGTYTPWLAEMVATWDDAPTPPTVRGITLVINVG